MRHSDDQEPIRELMELAAEGAATPPPGYEAFIEELHGSLPMHVTGRAMRVDEAVPGHGT